MYDRACSGGGLNQIAATACALPFVTVLGAFHGLGTGTLGLYKGSALTSYTYDYCAPLFQEGARSRTTLALDGSLSPRVACEWFTDYLLLLRVLVPRVCLLEFR